MRNKQVGAVYAQYENGKSEVGTGDFNTLGGVEQEQARAWMSGPEGPVKF